jgi:ATP-dependent RNA helicase DeaD
LSDFDSLGISDSLIKKLQYFGIVSPTPIQEKAIPTILEGKDLIAQAQTGTGKTLAFILPILERMKQKDRFPSTLIITPTRELALQITEEINKMIMADTEIHVLAVYGGQDVEEQLKTLEGNVQIVVGTPGRLLDHIRRETLQLSQINFLVLDEADQMLHIGFLNEVEKIILETPLSRQTLLFSATFPTEIREIANKYMNKPEYVKIEKIQGPGKNVKQIAIHTTDRAKQATLINVIKTYRPFLAIIFCRTKRRVTRLYEALVSHHFNCDELHGDLSQAKREQVMKRFRNAEIKILIATDVAARGLDVDGVTHVFNYDIPHDTDSYIHRIGRTGRAGTRGIAITLYSSKDRPFIDIIEKELKTIIPKKQLNLSQNEKDKTNTKKEQNFYSKQKIVRKKRK